MQFFPFYSMYNSTKYLLSTIKDVMDKFQGAETHKYKNLFTSVLYNLFQQLRKRTEQLVTVERDK